MGMLLDMVNDVQTSPGVAVGTLSVTTQGAAQDFSNCKLSTAMIVNGSVSAAAGTSAVFVLEECGTSTGTFTAVAGVAPGTVCAVTITATTAAANLTQVAKGFRKLRYCRVNAQTLAATTTTGFVTAASAVIVAQREYTPSDAGQNSGSPSGTDTYPGNSF